MHRLLIAVSIITLFLIGCSPQATPTPTAPPPTTAPVAAPTDTPTQPPTPTETLSPTAVPPTAVPTAVPITGTVKSTVNVRATPALTGKLLGTLNKGDTVTLLGRSADSKWFNVNFPLDQTSTGWVLANLVQTSTTVANLPALNAQGTPAAGTPTQVALGTATQAATSVPGAATPTLNAEATNTPGSAVTRTVTATVKPQVTGTTTPVATGGAPSGSILFDSFVNGQYQMNRVRADGTGLSVLFVGGSEPALSIKGTLAYHKRNGAAGVALVTSNLDGSNERIIVNDSTAGYPTWSPDGNNLAYHLTGNGQIFWITAQPNQTPQLVNARGGFRPAWQPGGNTLMFDGCDGNGGHCASLHTENAFTPDPQNPALVTSGTNAAWAPNGQQVAFQARDAGGHLNIFIANRDGSNKRQVTKDNGQDGLPTWSADGQWLFYRSDQNGTSWAVYAIRVDGSGARKIVDAPVNGSDWVYEKLAIAP